MTGPSLLTRLRPVTPSLLVVTGFACLILGAFLLGVFLSGALFGFVLALPVTAGSCFVLQWLLLPPADGPSP